MLSTKSTESIPSDIRDFTTVSPSAKSLLLMKAHTDIPFARQTAELLCLPEPFVPDFTKKDKTFWARTLHFETRYWGIDQLLKDAPVANVLELCSGYSFRGLASTQNSAINYIDTDLHDIIASKRRILAAISGTQPMRGKLDLLPLNAMDKSAFRGVVARFPVGELAIINEGLLMYLDAYEKEKLCEIIRRVLLERDGYWITADIYLKNQLKKFNLELDKSTQDFLERHNLEDNKFNTFGEAESFFKRMGFALDKVASIDRSKLSSLAYFKKSLSIFDPIRFGKAGAMHATWRLRAR
jgi:O-methyltransferase involved in polyketide biosynthesis